MDDTIMKLIEVTKENKLKWDYLDGFSAIYEPLNLTDKPINDLAKSIQQLDNKRLSSFDKSNSFYTILNHNYIVLISYSKPGLETLLKDTLELVFITRTFKEKKIYEGTLYDLLPLHNVVRRKFPSVDDILEDLNNL